MPRSHCDVIAGAVTQVHTLSFVLLGAVWQTMQMADVFCDKVDCQSL
jgi:hypothetical protein